MGIPEYEAKRYDGRVRKGSILLSVHCDSSEWVTRAKDILKQTGAEDISSTSEASSDYGKTDRPLARGPASDRGPVSDREPTSDRDRILAKPRTRTGGGSL